MEGGREGRREETREEKKKKNEKEKDIGAAAQLVKHPTSAQVMISRSVSLSPALGSVLTAQRLEDRKSVV